MNRNRNVAIILAVLLLVAALLAVDYFHLQNQSFTGRLAGNQSQATLSPTELRPATLLPLPPTGSDGWQTYRSTRFGFALDYPADWMLLVLPDATYQVVTDQVWLSPQSIAFPRPGIDAKPPLVFEITLSDPAANWKPEYFNNYEAKAYNLGSVEGTRISGVNKEGLNDELVILARSGVWYLSVYPSQDEDRVTQATIDRILATLRMD